MEFATQHIVEAARDFFLGSRDFNGPSGAVLIQALRIDEKALRELLGEAVKARKLDIAFASHSENPHVKRIPTLPVVEQLERLAIEVPSTFCIYPSEEVIRELLDLSKYDDRPFSKRLALGEPQLTPVFFELSILETYFRDPRYRCRFHGYSGSISINDEYYESDTVPERDRVLLQTFGLGYDEDRNRVIAVFLRYLYYLSPEHQRIWNAQHITRRCVMNQEYERATLYGHWPHTQSVYDALVLEQVELNKLAALIGKPPLFLRVYEDERPEGFHPMLRPTRLHYEEFAHLLDKMLSENLNRDFFAVDIPLEANGKPLGTLTLLERWLSRYYRTADGEDRSREIVAPFRKVRSQRQKPAHHILKNEYDPKLPREQDQLIGEAYTALNILRLVFSSHPRARCYEAPEWLERVPIVIH